MAKDKKTFANAMAIRRADAQDGLDAMFPASAQDTEEKATAQPHRYANQKTTTADGRKQITFKLPVEIVEKIRRVAYWERMEQWQVVDEALQTFMKEYEEGGGKLKPIPER